METSVRHSLKKALPKAYCSTAAPTIEDAQKLVEAGFEYVTEIDGVKLFRKRK